MNKTYVTCVDCKHWTDEMRIFKLCGSCNNSRLVLAPEENLCNHCGKSMCIAGVNSQMPHGLYNAKVSGSYNSYHLIDMTSYTFSLCEQCLRQLFLLFIIPPTVKDIDFDDSINNDSLWSQDQEYYEYRVWKDDGGHHNSYLNQKCNSIKNCLNEAVYSIFYDGEFSEDCVCEDHKEKYNHSWYTLMPFVKNNLKVFL